MTADLVRVTVPSGKVQASNRWHRPDAADDFESCAGFMRGRPTRLLTREQARRMGYRGECFRCRPDTGFTVDTSRPLIPWDEYLDGGALVIRGGP